MVAGDTAVQPAARSPKAGTDPRGDPRWIDEHGHPPTVRESGAVVGFRLTLPGRTSPRRPVRARPAACDTYAPRALDIRATDDPRGDRRPDRPSQSRSWAP